MEKWRKRDIKEGDVFFNLKVIKDLGLREFYGRPLTYYECECLLCGKHIDVCTSELGHGKKSCGCLRRGSQLRLKPGDTYNGFEILSEPVKKGSLYHCTVKCPNCGKIYSKAVRSMKKFYGKSCGCIRDEVSRATIESRQKKAFIDGSNVYCLYTDRIESDSTSGFKNISWHKKRKKWWVRIDFRKKHYDLGYFDNINEASQIAEEARLERKKDLEGTGNFIEWYNSNF